MFNPGDVISYLEMCQVEGVNLQRGMNYRLHGKSSVILMSLRPNAPYADKVEDNGKTLLYEGHDIPKKKGGFEPKNVDQPMKNHSGSLTQNGLFFNAAKRVKKDHLQQELIRVYEKIRSGIWVYNGVFRLVDAWLEKSNSRRVFKFKMALVEEHENLACKDIIIEHNRLIPSSVKLDVWKRDKGKCVKCGSKDNLHFDHIIPYSKGGSSMIADNIQLLCARHNLLKKDNHYCPVKIMTIVVRDLLFSAKFPYLATRYLSALSFPLKLL